MVDVAGLYLGPPDKAVVLCTEEKLQIQVLDRTQPSLPRAPKGLAVHVILDNYGTNGHANVRAWLANHPASTYISCLFRARGST